MSIGCRLHPVSRLAPPSIHGRGGFLCWLAHSRGVAASTHKQALSALLFFYRKALGADLPWITEIGIPCGRWRLPVVLSPEEVARILCLLDGKHRLFAQQSSDAGTTRLDDRFGADVRLTGVATQRRLGAVLRSAFTGSRG